MKKAVVLLSGGLDSTTCLAMAKDSGYEVHTISFDYGQRHRGELEAASNIAEKMAAKTHRIISLGIDQMGGSALTNQTIDVPDYVEGATDIPITYVPARNTVFLSIALGLAEVLEAQAIFIGVSSVDYSGYPDCRPAFIAAFENMANLATKMGVEGKKISIHTPLLHLSKAQTIQAGHALSVDYGQTVSCYRLDEHDLACGRCDSCVLRQKGFMDANVPDPTRYINA